MWDEAGDELHRLQNAELVTGNHPYSWKAAILLGERRDQEVIELSAKLGDRGRIDVALAVAYARIGQRENALASAHRAIQSRDQGAERAMGRAMEELGDLDGALFWYERAAKRIDRERSLRAMGKVLFRLSDYVEAAWALAQSARMSRYVHDDDIALIVECLRRQGHANKAAELEYALNSRTTSEAAQV